MGKFWANPLDEVLEFLQFGTFAGCMTCVTVISLHLGAGHATA